MVQKALLSGTEFKSLRNFLGLTQQNVANLLSLDRGTLVRLEKQDVIPAEILSRFIEATNLQPTELENIIIELRKKTNFSHNQGKDFKVEEKINSLLYDNFSQNLKGKDAELESLRRSNADLHHQLDNSNIRFFEAQRQIDAFRHQMDLDKLHLEQKFKDLKDEILKFVQKSIDDFANDLQEQFKTELQQAFESKGSLGDKLMENAQVFSPMINLIGKALERLMDKIPSKPQNTVQSKLDPSDLDSTDYIDEVIREHRQKMNAETNQQHLDNIFSAEQENSNV